MGNHLVVNCVCGCPPPVGRVGLFVIKDDGSLVAWTRQVERGWAPKNTECPFCGCLYDVGMSGGRLVQLPGKTKPRIDSIDVTSGPPTGGTRVALAGHALDAGTLVVRFDGVPAAIVSRTRDGAVVTTPTAPRVRVRIEPPVIGSLTEGQMVVGASSGHGGTVLGFDGGQLLLASLDGPLAVGEWLMVDDSNVVKVAASDIYAPCAVTVENENGRRDVGGSLLGAFTYA